MNAETSRYISQLRVLIDKHFSLAEIKLLCFDLGVSFDDLEGVGEGKQVVIHSLLLHLKRRGRLGELLNHLRRERPGVAWSDGPSQSVQPEVTRPVAPPSEQTGETRKPRSEEVPLWKRPIFRKIGAALVAAIFLLAALAEIYGGFGIRDWIRKQTVSPDPELAETFITQGKAYAAQGNYDWAIAEFDKALVLVPENAEALYNRGNAYYGQGNYVQSIADFSRYLELEPEAPNSESVENLISEMKARADIYFNQGKEQFDNRNYDEAINLFDQAIALDPDYARAFYWRGRSYYEQGDYNQAIDNHSQAIAIYSAALDPDPEYASAYYGRGLAYLVVGNYPQAVVDLSEAITLNPESSHAFHYRGRAYTEQGDFTEAIADYTQSIVLNPEHALAFYWRGRAYYEQAEYNQAIDDYSQAISLYNSTATTVDWEYPLAYYFRGFTYFELGNYEQAIADYRHYLELNPQASDRAEVENLISEMEAQLEN